MLQGVDGMDVHARALRRSMSPPEVRLWQALRTRPAGLKFRRQHPSGPYVADFYCHVARLVIEVDGEAHDRGDRPSRDAWFAQRGLQTLRLPARAILNDLDDTVRGIIATATMRLATQE